MFAITPRLVLRPGWPEDAAALARAIGHESVVRHLARAPWPYALGDAEAFLSLPRDAHEPRFQICTRSGDYRLIGGIGLMRVGTATGGETWELGYWLAPEAWGLGYATEAGRAVIDIARHALGLARIVARHHVDNPASGHVLAKLGFAATGTGETYSLARGEAVACIEHELCLRPDIVPCGNVPLAA